jgi:hypothetical protein
VCAGYEGVESGRTARGNEGEKWVGKIRDITLFKKYLGVSELSLD